MSKYKALGEGLTPSKADVLVNPCNLALCSLQQEQARFTRSFFFFFLPLKSKGPKQRCMEKGMLWTAKLLGSRPRPRRRGGQASLRRAGPPSPAVGSSWSHLPGAGTLSLSPPESFLVSRAGWVRSGLPVSQLTETKTTS